MFDVIYQPKGQRRKRLDFEGRACAIGSHRRNQLTIDNKRVNSQHAKVIMDQDHVCRIEDLNSKTGTWVNRQRITEPTVVDDKDEIIIGDTTLWIIPSSVAPSSLGAAKPSAAETKTPAPVVAVPVEAIDPLKKEMLDWSYSIHNQLIDQMDLRRRDVNRMSDEQLREETSQLIDEIIARINSDMPAHINREILKANVLNEAVGLGPLEKFLADDSISEIMVNNYADVFVEQNGKLIKSDYCFSSDQAVLSIIERIITPIGRRIDESSPMVDARLKDGSRVNAIIPPLALKGPSITIRKFSKKALSFNDLVDYGTVDQAMVDFLRVCVESRKNIIVSGGTGSGKTTLLNVLSNFIPKTERIVTVEDAAELKLNQPNIVSLEAKPANVEGKGGVAIRDLVKNTLRMRPDRIIVGECRGGEALDMLQAMNTGHDGSLTTTHANTPRDAFSRLEVMVLMAGMDLPVTAIREQIASAVDIIVQQTRFSCGSRKITKITEVVGVESGTIQLQDIFEYQQSGFDKNGKVVGSFKSLGFIPGFYEDLNAIGFDLDISIFQSEQPQYSRHDY